ncbi:hypothetical protein KIN20_026922 [Parelaphostrongylus tenuis]|uniref:Uncharacterized protein n=1 Tax=Parelaphostrongylus tenuis TaxID=148309 RepID=A0AAD5WDJ7_PARTN|nr:hypothetical protein KIN20_026922 [Parelaphostrongylus tenuis]
MLRFSEQPMVREPLPSGFLGTYRLVFDDNGGRVCATVTTLKVLLRWSALTTIPWDRPS